MSVSRPGRSTHFAHRPRSPHHSSSLRLAAGLLGLAAGLLGLTAGAGTLLAGPDDPALQGNDSPPAAAGSVANQEAPSESAAEQAARLARQFKLSPFEAVRLDGRTGESVAITAYISARDDAEMVFVPGGPFMMGSDYSEIVGDGIGGKDQNPAGVAGTIFEGEMPKHEVNVSPFFIDRYEVSNAQYARFLEWWEKSGHSREFSHPDEPLDFDHTPWQWKKSSFSDDDRPVVGVSWLSAYAYARWASKRLPTEAEWEKAARGLDGRRFPWGNRFDPRICNMSQSFNSRTLPVRSLPGGQSPYGCFNMCGNVTEYVLDWSNPKFYRSSPSQDPLNAPELTHKINKVVRGGNWNKYTKVASCRTTSRGGNRVWPAYNLHYTVDPRDYLITGFRCVASPVDQTPPPQKPKSWIKVFYNHPGVRHPDGETVVPARHVPAPPARLPGPEAGKGEGGG